MSPNLFNCGVLSFLSVNVRFIRKNLDSGIRPALPEITWLSSADVTSRVTSVLLSQVTSGRRSLTNEEMHLLISEVLICLLRKDNSS